MRRSGSITRYDDFTDFGDFIETAKKIQEEENHKAVTREQSIKEATEALEKVPDYIWERLQEAGYITREPLKWHKSKALFAYFVELACEKYDITTEVDRNGQWPPDKIRNLKPFEILFGIDDLKGKIREYKKPGRKGKPLGHEEVEKIFEK